MSCDLQWLLLRVRLRQYCSLYFALVPFKYNSFVVCRGPVGPDSTCTRNLYVILFNTACQGDLFVTCIHTQVFWVGQLQGLSYLSQNMNRSRRSKSVMLTFGFNITAVPVSKFNCQLVFPNAMDMNVGSAAASPSRPGAPLKWPIMSRGVFDGSWDGSGTITAAHDPSHEDNLFHLLLSVVITYMTARA